MKGALVNSIRSDDTALDVLTRRYRALVDKEFCDRLTSEESRERTRLAQELTAREQAEIAERIQASVVVNGVPLLLRPADAVPVTPEHVRQLAAED